MALNDFTKALVYAVPKFLNFPEVRDQGFLHAPLIRAFKALGGIREEATALELRETIRIARHRFTRVTNPLSSAYLDFVNETVGDTTKTYFSNAEYRWYQMYGRLILEEKEIARLANDQRAAKAWIKNHLEGFMMSWGIQLEEQLLGYDASNDRVDPLSGGSANRPWGDEDFPPNLLYWVDGPIPVSGTPRYFPYTSTAASEQTMAGTWKPPGEVDRSGTVNRWWNSIHIRPSTAEALTYQKLLYPMTMVQAGGHPSPNLIVMNSRAFSHLQGTLVAQQSWVNVESSNKEAKVGFTAIRVLNAIAIVDDMLSKIWDGTTAGSDGTQANASRNTILYLNTDDIKIRAQMEIQATPVDLPHPIRFWKVVRNVAVTTPALASSARYTNWYV